MIMNIVVISQRDYNYCYDLATKLYENYSNEIFRNIFGVFKKNYSVNGDIFPLVLFCTAAYWK